MPKRHKTNTTNVCTQLSARKHWKPPSFRVPAKRCAPLEMCRFVRPSLYVFFFCKRWSVCSNVVKPPLVCWSCDVRRFVGFPCGPFHWFALVVRLGRSHERCVRRHCYVPKFVVFVWEIVGSGKFTVARLAMISRQLPARPQSEMSVSQLASSSSVCCERCVCDGRVVLCDGARALSLVGNPSLCLSAHNTNQHVVSTASR